MGGNVGNKVKKLLYVLSVISVYHDMINVLFLDAKFPGYCWEKENIFKVYLCVSVCILLVLNMHLGPHEVIHKYLRKCTLKKFYFFFCIILH